MLVVYSKNKTKQQKKHNFPLKKRKKNSCSNLSLLFLYKFRNLYIRIEVEKTREAYETENFFKKMTKNRKFHNFSFFVYNGKKNRGWGRKREGQAGNRKREKSQVI